MKLKMFEVLKDEGKYSEHPLERLTIDAENPIFGNIKLLCTVEKVWFCKHGYMECYRIEKNETDWFFTDGKYVLVDVWHDGKCEFLNRQQVKTIGCLER